MENLPSTLTALANLISFNIKTLEAAYDNKDIPYPSLNEPFVPGPLDKDPSLEQTRRTIIGAAAQIIAAVRLPTETMFQMATQHHMSAALGAVTDLHIADIINDTRPQGLHARKIASKAGIDESKTARILRFLASNHVFREVSPNVFANNRNSSVLLKTKKLAELKAEPVSSYDHAGIAAFVAYHNDETLKSIAHFSEAIVANKPGVVTPFKLAWNTDKALWEWYEEPGNELRVRRFAVGMKAYADQFAQSEVLVKDSYWGQLTEDDTVVDMGGSVGSATMRIARKFPKPRFVVQDLDNVINNSSIKFWDTEYPDAVNSGRVQLQAHNFFDPQPVKNASVYFLRFVLHDWSDDHSRKILSHIRAAASPESRLIIFEDIMAHACPETSKFAQKPAPYPLLANYGAGKGNFQSIMDVHMMAMFDGQERTIEEYMELGNATGWKLEAVDVDNTAKMSGLLFVPVEIRN